MLKYKVILILSACIGIAAVALGFLAFRLSLHEEEYQKNQLSRILDSECQLLSDRFQTIINQEKQQLTRRLRTSLILSRNVFDVQQQNPLIKAVFIANKQGKITYPLNDQTFKNRYYNLFFKLEKQDFSKPVSRQIASNSQQVPFQNSKFNLFNKSKKRYSKVRQTNQSYEANQNDMQVQRINAKRQVAQSIPQQQTQNKRKFATNFEMLVNNQRNGWISWFTENKFCPLIWTRSDESPDTIIGAELETIAFLSRLIPSFPVNLPEYYRIELINAHGKAIYGTGFHSNNGELNKGTQQLKPETVHPVSDLFPNWRIQGYIDPGFSTGAGSLFFANMLMIGALLLIILAAGTFLFWLMHREMLIAGQKTTFVANVSHELKTPLTSIRMYAEMLLNGKDRLNDDKKHRYLNVVLTESERLSRLIANVLDFSKMEDGKKKFNPGTIELKKLIEDVQINYQPTVSEAGITLKTELPDNEITVVLDRDSLIQVLQNLISNACKYAADGKEITVKLQQTSANSATIKVMDRGKGIPKSARNKIFNKFYRCDDSLTSQTRGSGLGLTIARNLMREQNGDLIYSERLGKGAIFTIIINTISSSSGRLHT